MTQAEKMQEAILSGIKHQTNVMVAENDLKGLQDIAILLRDYAKGHPPIVGPISFN